MTYQKRQNAETTVRRSLNLDKIKVSNKLQTHSLTDCEDVRHSVHVNRSFALSPMNTSRGVSTAKSKFLDFMNHGLSPMTARGLPRHRLIMSSE